MLPITDAWLKNIVGLIFIVIILIGCDNNQHASNISKLDYQLIYWQFLAPPLWKAEDLYKGIDLSHLQDNDPKAEQLLVNVRAMWNNAPVIAKLNGKKITISGYVVPLDGDYSHIKQFLLVPYFGACIHSPPPPSNQIIHVYDVAESLVFNAENAVVTVSGILEVAQSETALGTAGYKMKALLLKPTEDLTP